MDLILKGIVTGFVLSIMIGPVFFVLLETSIRKGVRAALALDFGVLVSDIAYIVIAYLFYKEVEELVAGENNAQMYIIGGTLFLTYGIITFFKKVKEIKVKAIEVEASNPKDYIFLGIKGFALNFMNPLVVFYWFSVMTLGAEESSVEHANMHMFGFLAIILLTFFGIDVLKILGAKRLRPLVTPKLLAALNRLTGIVFVAFSLFLIAEGMIILTEAT